MQWWMAQEELATNSEAEANQPLQVAGNLERLVWLALHYTTAAIVRLRFQHLIMVTPV